MPPAFSGCSTEAACSQGLAPSGRNHNVVFQPINQGTELHSIHILQRQKSYWRQKKKRKRQLLVQRSLLKSYRAAHQGSPKSLLAGGDPQLLPFFWLQGTNAPYLKIIYVSTCLLTHWPQHMTSHPAYKVLSLLLPLLKLKTSAESKPRGKNQHHQRGTTDFFSPPPPQQSSCL